MDTQTQVPAANRIRTFQSYLVAGWVVFVTALLIFDLRDDPSGRNWAPMGCVCGFVTILAQVVWINLDAHIHGRKVGAWRFGAIFFGPIAIWIWLTREYGAKAVYLIPFSIALYFVPVGLIVILLKLGWLPVPR